MNIDKNAIGNRIYNIRKEKGYTMEQFGKLVGDTPKGTVNNWEKGNNLPNKKRLEKIAILGNVSVEWLKYGDFSSYVSRLTNDYELKILNKFGENTLKNYKESLLDQLEIEKVTYNQDLDIIQIAQALYEQVIRSKKDSYYAPIYLEPNREYIFDKIENLSEKDFQFMLNSLLKEKNPHYDPSNKSTYGLVSTTSSMLYDIYKKNKSEFSDLKEFFL